MVKAPANKSICWAAVVVFLLTLAFWAPGVRYRLVNFDDNDYVFDNPHVLGGLTPAAIWWAWTDTAQAANWHPLTWMSLQADVSMSGVREQPVGKTPRFETPAFDRISSVMHLHNALLHAANATLLFLLMWMMLEGLSVSGHESLKGEEGGNTGRSPFTFHLSSFALFALLWAVHPLRAEAVAWVSERKEVLSAFFMLLTLVCHVRGHLIAALAFYALALSAKPVAVSLPVVVFAIDWWREGRPRWLRAAAYAVLAAACVGLTLLAQREVIEGSYLTFRERLPNVLAAFGSYAWQTLVPARLSLMYPVLERFDWTFTFASFLALSVFWIGRRSPLVRLSAAWVVVGLLPMIGIVQVGCQSHADRYTYWVGCGLTAVLGLMWVRHVPHGKYRAALLLLPLLLYGTLGWRQREAWYDTESIFGMSYRNVPSPTSATAYAQAVKTRDRDAAERIYREARLRFPDDAFTISQLAVFLAVNRGPETFDEARALAREALSLDDGNAFAFEALGFAAVRSGDFAEAEKAFLAAIERGSESPSVQRGLADARKGLAARPGPWRDGTPVKDEGKGTGP